MKNMNPRLRLGSIFFTLALDFFLHILKSYSNIVQYLLEVLSRMSSDQEVWQLKVMSWWWWSLCRVSRSSWWAPPRCWCLRLASPPTQRPGARPWPISWPASADNTRSVSSTQCGDVMISVQIPYLPLQHCLHSEVCDCVMWGWN